MRLEEALDLCYRGKKNVAKAAEEVEIPFIKMKDLLTAYILERPIHGDSWQEELEVSWPWC
jgi:hypothetical protein